MLREYSGILPARTVRKQAATSLFFSKNKGEREREGAKSAKRNAKKKSLLWHGLPARVLGAGRRAGSPCHMDRKNPHSAFSILFLRAFFALFAPSRSLYYLVAPKRGS
jgi:hypothetical protein